VSAPDIPAAVPASARSAVLAPEAFMTGVATVWKWLLARAHDGRPQLLLCVRVTVAAVTSYVLAQLLTVPLAGLWAVLTAVVVTQMSVGGSLKAAIEYSVGTLGGAVYAGVIGAFIPYHTELSLLAVLALAIAPLALLAAINPHFRVAPFTAVLVVVGTSVTHIEPIGSAFYRVLEVALGAFTGLAVSLLVLPARAQVLLIEAAAEMLDRLAAALPELLAGFTRPLEGAEIRRLHDEIAATYERAQEVGAEAKGEQMTYLVAQPDPASLLRTLLRLRHDLVMIRRAADEPFPELFQARLGPLLGHVGEAAADYLRSSSVALVGRRHSPTRDAIEAAFGAYAAAIAGARREGLTRNLPSDVVEHIFTLAFALEQLHRNLIDLARCVEEFAHSTIVSIRKGGDARTDQSWPSKTQCDRAQDRRPPDHGRGELMRQGIRRAHR
jgi:uncharacterized membrane protein YccC